MASSACAWQAAEAALHSALEDAGQRQAAGPGARKFRRRCGRVKGPGAGGGGHEFVGP